MIKDLLNFNYELSHFVSGLVDPDEAHEMFYEGFIKQLKSPTHPKTIGMFELLVYDIKKAKEFNQFDHMISILRDLSIETHSRFSKIHKLIDDYDLDFKNKERILYLKNVIIHPDCRKQGIFKELIKSIYLTHYTNDCLFIVNSSPLQNIRDEFDFHMMEYVIDVKNGDGSTSQLTTGNYFNLHELPEADEGYDYKLYAKMQSLNLTQFESTNFFYVDSEKDISKLFKSEKKSLNL